MKQLPTLDQFRKQFRDAVRAGLPIEKCLDMGTVWTGKGNPANMKDTFKASMKDALAKGLSFDKAIRMSVDAVPDESIVSGEGWEAKKDKPFYRVSADSFKGHFRDAMKAGKSISDAIKHSVDGCKCGH